MMQKRDHRILVIPILFELLVIDRVCRIQSSRLLILTIYKIDVKPQRADQEPTRRKKRGLL